MSLDLNISILNYFLSLRFLVTILNHLLYYYLIIITL